MFHRMVQLFNNCDFRHCLISRFLAALAKQMQLLIVMWQVYEIAHTPLSLGFIGLAEGLPYVAVGLWAGHLVDRLEKKGMILMGLGGLFACSGGLMVLSNSSNPTVLPIYLIIGLGAVFSSMELPAISSYMQIVVPTNEFPRAAGWNLTLYMVATIAGPILGGFLISRTCPFFAYGVVTVLFGLSIVIALFIKKIEPVKMEVQESSFQSIKSGLKFLVSKRIIFACMLLDSIGVLFGDIIIILPVFAEILQVGPIGLGFLRAAPAMGSFCTSMWQSIRPFIDIKWKTLLRAVVFFGVAIIAFALSKNIYLSVALLMLGGMADGVSVIVRQSVYQANTPDHLRGRVTSVSGIFIRVSNELGAFESGVAAQLMGTVPSVIFGGAMTLLTAGFMRWKFGRLDER